VELEEESQKERKRRRNGGKKGSKRRRKTKLSIITIMINMTITPPTCVTDAMYLMLGMDVITSPPRHMYQEGWGPHQHH
jgi:hypothetical protein